MGKEVPRLQARTVTPRDHFVHPLQQPLEFTQHAALEFAETLGILSGLHLLECPFPVALVDGLAQRRCAAEVSMSQEFDLANAELGSSNGLHEAFDFLGADTIHAHERPQCRHVRVDGKRAAEEDVLHFRTHLGQQIATRTDPGLAPREQLGDVGERHPLRREQLVHEPRLLQDAERPLLAGTQQVGNTLRFVFTPADIRHAFDAQLGGTAVPPEAIQQQATLRRVDASQRLFDSSIGDCSQQPRFGSAVPQSKALVAEIQAAAFHALAHRWRRQGGC